VAFVIPSLPIHTQKPEQLAHDSKIYLFRDRLAVLSSSERKISIEPCRLKTKPPERLASKGFCG